MRTLRHTFAVHSLAKGTAIETMQKALGLASPASLEDYRDAALQVMNQELQRNALQVHIYARQAALSLPTPGVVRAPRHHNDTDLHV